MSIQKKKIKFENYFTTKQLLIVVQAEVAKQKCKNVHVGSLETPTDFPLTSCSSVNTGFTLNDVDGILRRLGTKPRNFALLLTNAARYMSLDGKTKGIRPIPFYDACHLHCALTK